ncbi:MAG: hypothetical protein P4L20_00235 [Acidimicrobiales bacterium]|nr:hypothetical protein [Acidimicrobiales bacterium]
MTRFRMLLVVVGSALVFTFVGPFLYRAVGLDSPVGTCSPVGNSSPVGNNSPVGSCSPVGTQAPTRISNSLSGGGETGAVITVGPGTPVTDQATLSGANISSDPATVTYTVYSLSSWHWGWNKVASGGTVTVTGGVVPPSQPVTLGPGVYTWKASYSGDANNAPSVSRHGSGIEIVFRPFHCSTGGDGWSDHCFHGSGEGNHNGGQGNNGGQGQGYDNGGGSNSGGQGNNDQGNGNGNDHGGQGQGYDNGGGSNSGGQGNNDHGNGGWTGWGRHW